MTKQDETKLKKIISKFANIDVFLDYLKKLEERASNSYIKEGSSISVGFDPMITDDDVYFTIKHLIDNNYIILFNYNCSLFIISFIHARTAGPCLLFAQELVQEAREIFERLDKELREEREQEFASKISELKDKGGAELVELAKEQIREEVEHYTDNEEFIEIENNYIKPSAIVAVYEDAFEYPCVKIILKGGQEIKTKHVLAANIFDFLEKNKESFIRLGDMYIRVYIRPEYVMAIYVGIKNGEYNVVNIALKYGGEVVFPASRYTADEIVEELKKGGHENVANNVRRITKK